MCCSPCVPLQTEPNAASADEYPSRYSRDGLCRRLLCERVRVFRVVLDHLFSPDSTIPLGCIQLLLCYPRWSEMRRCVPSRIALSRTYALCIPSERRAAAARCLPRDADWQYHLAVSLLFRQAYGYDVSTGNRCCSCRGAKRCCSQRSGYFGDAGV